METETITIPIDGEDRLSAVINEIQGKMDGLKTEVDAAAKSETAASKTTEVLTKKNNDLSKALLGPIARYTTIAGAIAGVVSIEKQAIQAAAEHEAVMTRLSQTLSSTGRDVEISATQLEAMASAMMQVTAFDDEKILDAYAAIAKFSDVPTDAIDDITMAAANLSAAMGGDLATNAEAITRVLETGLIPRSWGFNDALKKQIEELIDAGDKAGALNLILTTLNERYGGQAIAQMNTYNGQLERLKNNWGDTLEALGNAQLVGGKGIIALLNDALVAFNQVIGVTQNLTRESWNLLSPLEKIALLFSPGGVFTGIRALIGQLTTNLPGVDNHSNPEQSSGGGGGGGSSSGGSSGGGGSSSGSPIIGYDPITRKPIYGSNSNTTIIVNNPKAETTEDSVHRTMVNLQFLGVSQ